jgi:predicted nuclease of predicted toxin-antitoxin system
VRFLVDAQLPVRLVHLLREAGHEALHVADVDLLSATDAAIRRHAEHHGMIVITKDEDFAMARQLTGRGPAVLWIRLGNTTNHALVAKLKPLLDQVLAALAAGETVVEIR